MATKRYKMKIRSRKIQVVLDKVLFLRLLRRLHGRFWGVFGLVMLDIALLICFMLRPELRSLSTAFSDFGTDIQTAPFFIAGVFLAAYGLWRWRNYLSRTFRHPGLSTLLITLIIVGLYLIVFMPVGINERLEAFHYFGFALAGLCMALTVLTDMLLRRTRRGKNYRVWQFVRFISLLMIVGGGIISLLSSERYSRGLDITLVGEALILTGFGLWVIIRTYQGEGTKSNISKILNKIIIID